MIAMVQRAKQQTVRIAFKALKTMAPQTDVVTIPRK
jgi:hypothetical protein